MMSNKKLEDFLDLAVENEAPLIESAPMQELENAEEELPSDITGECTALMQQLDNSKKIDLALEVVGGLSEHDTEMDDIAKRAMDSYVELCQLGLTVSDTHSAKMFDVAAAMLKTAMDAKDNKVSRKLKTIELQLKKDRLDFEKNGYKPVGGNKDPEGAEFDRNELLEYFKENVKTGNEE